MSTKTLSLIKEHNAQWVDLRFTDTLGKEHHITFPSETFDEEALEEGRMFDGSSIHGWKGIEASDMTLLPDVSTLALDQNMLCQQYRWSADTLRHAAQSSVDHGHS